MKMAIFTGTYHGARALWHARSHRCSTPRREAPGMMQTVGKV